jgi:virginiamycin A acetyltransferase
MGEIKPKTKSIISIIEIGRFTYGTINVYSFLAEDEYLKIGSFCSIADGVKFMLGGNHSYTNLSTYPFKTILVNSSIHESLTKGPIIVDDDVWIGEDSMIMSGVRLGRGCIIAALSVVHKDVPPYAIYAGNVVKKFRFTADIISKLMEFDFTKLTKESITNKIGLLYLDISETFFEDPFFIYK